MDPTDITKRSIKVIAKHGDDLRQDMLTLQMLTLMDKVIFECVCACMCLCKCVCVRV